MRASVLVVLLAAACLLAIGSFATSAQVIDASPCEKACYEQESSCISACDDVEDPIECEARCHDARSDCLEQCG